MELYSPRVEQQCAAALAKEKELEEVGAEGAVFGQHAAYLVAVTRVDVEVHTALCLAEGYVDKFLGKGCVFHLADGWLGQRYDFDLSKWHVCTIFGYAVRGKNSLSLQQRNRKVSPDPKLYGYERLHQIVDP